MKKIVVGNIEYEYIHGATGIVSEQEELGLSYITIPGAMSDRFRKECGFKDEVVNRLIFPHYDRDQMFDVPRGSDHECYNSDTQIVLMHWLMNKNRKYKLKYFGLDPFWLFHDSFHAKNDVWGFEVQGIWSNVEWERLLEGAEYALKNGISISAETVAKLDAAWDNRWRRFENGNHQRFNYEEFNKFLKRSDVDHLAWMVETGYYSQNNNY